MSMNKPITRKQFLDLGLGAMSLVGLAACGGDDSEDEGAGTDDTGADTTVSTTNTTTASTTNTTTASTTTNSTTESTTVSTTDDDTTESSTTDGNDTTGDTTAGDTVGDTTTGSANMCDADPTSMFSGHMHTLDIPLADIIAGTEQNYVAGGSHTHDVTLTADDFATLRETGQVVVMAADGGDPPHPHTVTIICA